MQRFLWMVLRSVCRPRRKQKVEIQMARQTREMTMPTHVMTDSSSSLMRPWYWGRSRGHAEHLWPCTHTRARPGATSCSPLGLLPPTWPSVPPWSTSQAPTPLQVARSLPMLWQACGEMAKVDTNLILQWALGEGGTQTRESQTCGLLPWARLRPPYAHEGGLPWHHPSSAKRPCKAEPASRPARRSGAPASLRSRGAP